MSIISDGLNSIELVNEELHLSTLSDAHQYAFYLYFKESVEKVMYGSKRSVFFKKNNSKGVYRAVFFKKEKDGNKVVENLYFSIIDNNLCKIDVAVVEETDNYKITNYDLGHETTFIVFMETNTTKNTRPFGLDFLISRGYNVIACNQNNDQYQGLSFSDFERVVSPLLKDRKVFLYGSSLGGYCAVYYAGAVNGTVIASAPRNSAHPVMLEYVDYGNYSANDFKHVNISENKKTKKNIYLFLDPYQRRDVYFIDKFIEPVYKKQLNLINFPHAGHEVLQHINKTGQLSVIIESIVNDRDFLGDIDINIDSEFSLYGKSEDAFKKMKELILKYHEIKSLHPTSKRKMDSLLELINNFKV